MSQKRTTGQKTGVESNAIAPDNIHGQLDSAGTGNQNPHGTTGTMNVPRLTSAMSNVGQSDGELTLFSGPSTGRSSNQNSEESSDSRERRWSTGLKPATAESPGVFGEGNAFVRLERSTDPYVTTERPAFKPGQGRTAGTKGDAD